MSQVVQKQMLWISVHRQDSEPYLKLELESYYRKLNRRIYTEKSIDVFDKKILLRDQEFKLNLGFSLILLLLVDKGLADYKGRYWAALVYPHYRGQQTVIRLDEEVYHEQPQRKFCCTIPLFGLSMEQEAKNRSFRKVLAENVLKYLPISEELCMRMDDERV